MASIEPPIIVLDGPDCSGKTSIADEIVRQTGASRIHLTYRMKSRMDLYHRWAIEWAARKRAATGKPVVVDRWWPSEIVYARAFRGRTLWPRNARAFDRIGRFYGVSYIFCVPRDRQTYVEAWTAERERRYASKPWALKGRGQSDDDMGKVYDLYSDVMTWMDWTLRGDVFRYDRFEHFGRVRDAAKMLVELASQVQRSMWDAPRQTLIFQPTVHQPGSPRHAVYPGAHWSEDQRVFDSMLSWLGVPDHRLTFKHVNHDPELLRSWIDSRSTPATLINDSREDFARVLEASGDWPETLPRLRSMNQSFNALAEMGERDVVDAANRLGLD